MIRIRAIEERAINAWPALQTQVIDGWLLQFARGYSKRANSVKPLYATEGDVQRNIERCERAYLAQGLDVVFRIVPALHGMELDQMLEARGYALAEEVSVQLAPLNSCALGEPKHQMECESQATAEWIDTFCLLNGTIYGEKREAMTQLLRSISHDACFILIREAGQAMACGFAVVEDGMAGLFDIFTASSARRQGYGKSVVQHLMHWAISRGATHAYLQVVTENKPARALYEQLGFTENHRYWYRVLPH